MSTSFNENPVAHTSTLAKNGQAIYEERLRSALEPEHSGEFIAIEPSTGRYFLGETATAALIAASNTMPESQFFLTRVGRNAAHKIGGHGTRIR